LFSAAVDLNVRELRLAPKFPTCENARSLTHYGKAFKQPADKKLCKTPVQYSFSALLQGK
jgi:hypothetical protein